MLSARLQLTRSRQSRYWLRLPGPLPAQRPAPRNTSSLAISLSLFSSASSSLSAHQGDNSGPLLSRNSGTKLWLELACQFHTIIAYLYILMYKEMQKLPDVGLPNFEENWP